MELSSKLVVRDLVEVLAQKGVKHIRMSKIKSDTKQFEKIPNEDLAKYAQATGGSVK